MAAEKKFTDSMLEKALVEANGQPTKAAEILGVKYISVYRRIKANPELNEFKLAQRSKTFNELYNVSTIIALAGVIRCPVVDEETGEVIPNKFINRAVDIRTRQGMISQLLTLFKSDEGIKDEIVIETKDNLDLSKLSDTALAELAKATKQ